MSEEEGDNIQIRQPQGKSLPAFIRKHFEGFRIGVFEGIGTLILAYAVCVAQYLTPVRDKIPNPFYSIFISFALFLGLCWSGSMTGGHLNPAVTLGQMFRTPKVNLRTALIYMLSQFVGALIGGLLAWGFYDAIAGPYEVQENFLDLFLDFLGEVLGTFLFVFFILMITTQQTTFVQDKYWIYIFVSLLLYTCRTFSFRDQSLNPAVAFGVMFFKAIQLKNGMLMLYSLTVILGPFLGGYLAGIFFQKVYKRIYTDWKSTNQIQ